MDELIDYCPVVRGTGGEPGPVQAFRLEHDAFLS
jgi:hypothetical protein